MPLPWLLWLVRQQHQHIKWVSETAASTYKMRRVLDAPNILGAVLLAKCFVTVPQLCY